MTGKKNLKKTALTVVFSVLSIIYIYPIVVVLINSFKTNDAINQETFSFPGDSTFVGLQNFIKGLTFGNYPFLKSVLYSTVITVLSVVLILLFC